MSNWRSSGFVIALTLVSMVVSGCSGVPAATPMAEVPTVAPTPPPVVEPTPTTQEPPTVTPPTAATPSPTVVPRKESHQLAPPLTGHTRSVTHLVFSRDGKMLASGSDDGTVILWDVHDLAAPARLGQPLGDEAKRVRSFALSPDGKVLVISTSSSKPPPMHVTIWDVSNPGAPVLLAEPPPVGGGFVVMYTLDFSPDGRVLAIGSEDRTITLWDMTDPASPVLLGSPLEGHRSGVLQVAFSPDGRVLASGDADGVIILWSMSDPKAPRKLATISDHEGAVSALAFSPDGKTLSAGSGTDVRLWDVSNPEASTLFEGLPKEADEPVADLDFSPDGSTLASSSGKTTILWDVSDRRAPARLGELRRTDSVTSTAFSPDGKTLATGSGDGAITLSSVSKPNLTAAPPAPPIPTLIPATEWPVSPLTEQQIILVNECDIKSLASARYPDTITTDELQSAFAPQSGCDWAALALGYAQRLGDDESLPEAAKSAFSQAVSRNFGFALATPIFYQYFGSTPLVRAPASTQQEITDINIKYAWGGLGDPVSYTLDIHQASTTPTLTVTPDTISASLQPDVDKELMQALAPALTDLLPIKSKFALRPCTDNYPDWDVTLTFADGTSINLTTDSNALFFGGPWFAEIDHQTYIQSSTAFAEALRELVLAVGLPIGETAAMSCFSDSVFDKAFP